VVEDAVLRDGSTKGKLSSGREFTDPDVAEADRVVVVLQRQRKFISVGLVGFAGDGWALNFDIVLHEYAVVKDGDAAEADEFSILIEARGMENDVVGLPLTGLPRGVDERRILAVDGGGLAVGVSLVIEGIEDLNFVHAHQEDAAIAAILILPFGWRGRGEFNVKLHIAEGLLRVHVAGFGNGFEVAVADFPFGGFAGFCGPGREVFAVEKNDCVARGFAGRVLGGGDAGIDDGRNGAVAIVRFPLRRGSLGTTDGTEKKRAEVSCVDAESRGHNRLQEKKSVQRQIPYIGMQEEMRISFELAGRYWKLRTRMVMSSSWARPEA